MKVAIITGDIINSKGSQPSVWVGKLKDYFTTIGTPSLDWELFRGDEFQLRVLPNQALEIALYTKALIKTTKRLDVRMGIGLGTESYTGETVSQSNGTAFQRSGALFETLRSEKINLAIATGNDTTDQTLNLMFALALDFMDDWSPVSAEMIRYALAHPNARQQQMAESFGIRQSAVSQRQKRARLELVLQLLEYYKKLLPTLG